MYCTVLTSCSRWHIYSSDTTCLHPTRCPIFIRSFSLVSVYRAPQMLVIDALSLGLSVLGVYGLVFSLRYLIPCYIIPLLSARLNETQQLLSHAEAINAIPPESEHQTHLVRYEDLYFDMLSSHTPIQFCEPICGDALAEQSRPRAIPATAPCYSAWLDLPTLCPLLSN